MNVGLLLLLALGQTPAGYGGVEIRLTPTAGVDLRGVEVVVQPRQDSAPSGIPVIGRSGVWAVSLPSPISGTVGCRSERVWCPLLKVNETTHGVTIPAYRRATVDA